MNFSKKNIRTLKDFIYYGYSHDAVLESFTYNGNGETAKIEFFNQFTRLRPLWFLVI